MILLDQYQQLPARLPQEVEHHLRNLQGYC